MILKSFSHISRHSAFSKTLFASHSPSFTQPSFFVTTNQLARQQSQLVIRNDAEFAESDYPYSSNSTYPHSYSAICNSSLFPTLSPLVTLDDDKRREAILEEDSNPTGPYGNTNHQNRVHISNPLTLESIVRRNSLSSVDDIAASTPNRSIRRYSTIKKNNIVNPPKTPPPSPAVGPVNPGLDQLDFDLTPLTVEKTVSEPISASSNSIPLESDTKPSQQMDTIVSKPIDNILQELAEEEHQQRQDFLELDPEDPKSIIKAEESAESKPSGSGKEPKTTTTENFQENLFPTLTKAQLELQQELQNNLLTAINTQTLPEVIASFNTFRSNSLTPTLKSYEYFIAYLVRNLHYDNYNPENISNVLTVYSDLLAKNIKPSKSVYASVITGLAFFAKWVKTHKESSVAYARVAQRHDDRVLSSVTQTMRDGDSSFAFYKMAIEIFEASNVVKSQRYPTAVYQFVLDACNAVGNYSLLYKVIKLMESTNCTLDANIFVSLLKGYGKYGDVVAFVETFKHYKALAGSLVNKKEFDVYAALIGAYFDSGKPQDALTFFKKILDNNPAGSAMVPVVSEIVKSFARTGDYASAVKWIKRVEGDSKLMPVDLQSLVETMSAIADAGDMDTARDLFDFVASKKDANNPLFNILRSDFVSLCVKANDFESLYKAIKETQLREGVWDLTSVINVCRYLLDIGDVKFSVHIFDVQTERYFDYMTKQGLPVDNQAADALDQFVDFLKDFESFTHTHVLNLLQSNIFKSELLSTNRSFTECLKIIWGSLADGTLEKLLSEKPFVIADIVNVHVKWIKNHQTTSGLSIPTSLLDDLRSNFRGLMNILIDVAPAVSEEFQKTVAFGLEALDETELTKVWKDLCVSTYHASGVSMDPDTDLPVISENRLVTNQIIIASQNNNTLLNAYEQLNSATIRGDIVGPDAYVSIIDAATTSNFPQLIRDVYKIALNKVKLPQDHPYFYEAWVKIHRAIVRTASIDYLVASSAYKHLLDLGVFPDATGYGQLIAGSPDNEEGVENALKLFHEARSNNVFLNTFIYNVLLSKLSKARRFEEAIYYFKDMDSTNIRKNNVTYGTIINACTRCNNESFARALFKEMESSPYYSPKVAPFNIMLQFYVQDKKDRRAALEFYEKLRKLDLSPSSHTYKLVIDAYTTIEPIDIASADKVLLEILADNNAITSKHYASLLYGRGVYMKDLDGVQKFYNGLVFNKRVRPDNNIFRAMLDSYVVNGAVKSTSGILKEMMSYGIELDTLMANTLIRGWAPISTEKSRGLFNHILSVGIAMPSTYESMVRAYLFYGNVTSAQEVIGIMISHLYPQAVVDQLQQVVDQFVKGTLTSSSDKNTMLFESVYNNDSPYSLLPTKPPKQVQGVLEDIAMVKSNPSLVEF